MKKIFLAIAFLFAATQLFSQTLFTYGKDAVSKDEFLRAYNKNKISSADKEKSLREYLDLYSNFKLKVKAASLLRMDTLPEMRMDVENFRAQIVEGYMTNKNGLSDLADEAFQRSQKDIHLLHFYIPVNDKMTPADTVKVYNEIQTIYVALKSGKDDYKELCSKDTAVSFSDLGYITAFSIPYNYENIIYGLSAGEASHPFRTKTGWHILKNADERKSIGKLKVAQILFALPQNASPETVKAAQQKSDSVYKLLQDGQDFATLAKKFSDDKLTYSNGGIMPEFGTGKYEPEFEEHVLEIKKDSEIAPPFLTSYGFHIVKKLQQTPTPTSKKDDGYMDALRQRVLHDPRMNVVNEKFLDEVVLPKTQYKRNISVKDADLFRYADSAYITKAIGNYPINNKVIFSFPHQSIKGSDWLNFVKDYKLKKGETDKEMFDNYVTQKAMGYYRDHLEEYNNEFKYQMREFADGNLLFAIMEENVWNKATNDSAGLMNYYNQHKEKYIWAKSADVLLFTCNSTIIADSIKILLRAGKDWRKIIGESKGKVQADSGRYEVSQISLPAGTLLTEGLITNTITNKIDNSGSFIQVLKIFPDNQQRSFAESKGLVINDYQNYLEEKWLQELKKKYPIKVNEAVFQSLLN
ncbi:MAG TPA: peptidylprolyl isomerase [Ferruginibacter sp.]|jgi:peptidyl-prolyl cis-trans isomerase SurA|nr:peptidylprolyl isomerase [Ferruginibacter sp.]